MTQRVNVAVIGSGFAGSILAWILSRQGLRVALIDGARHPRFAIGESSTPIADAILRRLGESYQLPDLVSLSTWGSWRRTHPELSCGRKRGFSYFVHEREVPFAETFLGERSLLVAASPNDEVADTHWYRPEVDKFFWEQAVAAGAMDLTGHQVVAIESSPSRLSFQLNCVGVHPVAIAADWIVDASGQAGVLAKQSGCPSLTDRLHTRTHSTFAHYTGVQGWNAATGTGHASMLEVDPFDPDDAAQHHLLDHGWVWMLRFNQGITSVGYTTTLDRPLVGLEQLTDSYPTFAELLRGAKLVAPRGGAFRSDRLQRFFDPIVDSRRIMLPTAAVTLDPLHSTGIAHALAGVERLCEVITSPTPAIQRERIEGYRHNLMAETQFLDRLVSTAYSMIDDFPRFTVACMLYFAGAIRCEERYQRGDTPEQLWNADDPEFVRFVDESCVRLGEDDPSCFEEIRRQLNPWNTAGLMDRGNGNRYAYTATKGVSRVE